MLLNESMSKWQAVRSAPHVHKWNNICYYHLTLIHDNLPGFSPGDTKILGWCPAGCLTSWGKGAFLALVGHPSSDKFIDISANNFRLHLVLSVCLGFLNFFYSRSELTNLNIRNV